MYGPLLASLGASALVYGPAGWYRVEERPSEV